jgi:hypothetical protein
MPWSFIVPAALSLFSSSQQSNAAQSASTAANEQAQKALDLQQRMYEENIARQQPRLSVGNNALAQMQSGAFAQPAPFVYNPNKYTASAGYQSSLEEGLRGIRNRFAAGGGTLSGAALKATEEYGRRKALEDSRAFDATDYARALDAYNASVAQSNTGYNRLAGLADVGQTANTQIGPAGQTYATNAGNLMTNQGDNTGNAMMLAAQGRNSAYQGIGNLFGRTQPDFSGMFGGGGSSGPVSMPGYGGMYDPAYMGR